MPEQIIFQNLTDRQTDKTYPSHIEYNVALWCVATLQSWLDCDVMLMTDSWHNNEMDNKMSNLKRLQIQTKSDIIWQKKTITWPEKKHLNMKSIKMVMTVKCLQSVFYSELNKISQTFSNKQTNCNYNPTVIIAATVTIKRSVFYDKKTCTNRSVNFYRYLLHT